MLGRPRIKAEMCSISRKHLRGVGTGLQERQSCALRRGSYSRWSPARGGGAPAVELERGGWGSPGGLLRSGLCPSTQAGACRKLFPCEFGRRISPSWAVSKTSRQDSILGLIPRLSCPSAPVQTPAGSCSEPWVLLAVQYDSSTAVEAARPGWCGQEGSPP